MQNQSSCSSLLKVMHLVPPLIVLLLMLLLQSCGTVTKSSYHLTIAHLNDTHSHIEAEPVSLTINGHETVVHLGGFARLQTLLDEMRQQTPDILLLHAGDAVQGTLYFTLFNGQVEFDFLNRLKVDVMTFGNHEFDRGTAAIPSFLKMAKFPIVSSNIDFSEEPAIAALVRPYVVKQINGEQIGIIGLTTETTPQTTIDVGRAKFLDARTSAARQVDILQKQGIDKIIALSHLGYEEDLKLAAAVNGIDVVVGGHTHSLLGDQKQFSPLGLISEGRYPTEITTPEGGRTLILQSWQWGHMLGRIDLSFDQTGNISGYTTGAIIPVGDSFSRDEELIPPDSQAYQEIVQTIKSSGIARLVPENSATVAAQSPYAAKLEKFRTTSVAVAAEELIRGINSGPGPLVADSMLAAVPNAQVAILNYGSVRKDLLAGTISVADVLEVMPFANSLVLVDLTGAELKSALEGAIDFLLVKYGSLNKKALPYVSGINLNISKSAPKGSRIVSLSVKDHDGIYRPLDPTATYRTVVNIFVAGGGDGFSSFKSAKGFRSNTGIIDSDAFHDLLKALRTIRKPTEQRIKVLSTDEQAGLIPRQADNYEVSPAKIPAAA
jgi:5'-nucleotidase/UDP-sugar diphosphatase